MMVKEILNKKKTDIQSVGLDVCKASVRVCFRSNTQKIDYEFKNNSQGVKQFCEECKKEGLEGIPFTLESTGDYHLLLMLELRKYGLNVIEINPIITKQYIRSSIRGSKTDKSDAEILGKIGVIEGDKLRKFDRTEEIIVLKKKISLIGRLEKELQSVKAAISKYNESLKKLGVDIGEEIGKDVIKSMKEMIKNLQKEIEREKFGEEETEKIKVINSITGISKYMANVFYIQFAHIEFKSKDEMYAFVGCEPKLKQSGIQCVGTRMSKRGNGYTRKKLYQSAYCGKYHCKELGKIYDRMREKGKHHYIALNVVMKKIIHIIRSLLKHNTYFDPALV